MDQKEFESKLDEYANKISGAVSEGVKKVEAAFEKGRDNIKSETASEEGLKGLKGSPRMGLILVAVGILWLLFTLDFFDQWIFPVLLMIVGLYFVIRNR
jgi:fatty acid desaturase